jgi:hypothetical protein
MAEQQQPMKFPTLIDARTYTKDATGKGVFLGTEQPSPYTPAQNAGSLRPMGGAVVPQEAQGAAKVAMKEDLENLFSGEELSEEFKQKAVVVFEAAINERISEIREQLINEGASVIQTEVNNAVEGLASRLDEYLSYVVEEWMKENKLAVESGIRTEIAESFMNGLKNLFESHYVEVPETKNDVLEDLFVENQELEKALNEQLQENMNFKKEIVKGQARAVFLEATNDLTKVDSERLAALAENIDFNDVQEFHNKITILKENYLKAAPVATAPQQTTTLTENVSVDSDNVADSAGPMSVYMNTLSRQLKKL